MKRIILYLGIFLLGIVQGLSAQEAAIPETPTTATAFGLSIGTVTLDDRVYNSIRLMPEIAYGKLGVGVDVDFRFNFDNNNSGDTRFRIYQPDWYIAEDATFQKYLNLYLSKFSYIRWGEERDPLHIRFGSLTNTSLGTGFIMGGYSNTLFQPAKRIFGGQFNVDGALFKFPQIGFQGMVSNLSELDLYGGRIYIRPLASSEIPILKNMEVGGSYYMDRLPYLYLEDVDEDGNYDAFANTVPTSEDGSTVTVTGVDTIIPIIMKENTNLALMGDFVIQSLRKRHTGGMVGVGGNFMFLNYMGQLRFLGENFQAVYFDQTYDLTRHQKYWIYNEDIVVDATNAYYAALGASFMQNSLGFNFSLEGPLRHAKSNIPSEYPRLKGVLYLSEGTIDFVDFQFWYDKPGIQDIYDVVDPENALIGGLVNFRISPAVITMQVDVKYDPNDPGNWIVTSQISTGVQF